MLTAARGATLVLLGALLAQAPLTAQAYQPRDPQLRAEPAATASPDPTTRPARSWSDVVKQVTETSPGDVRLRSADESAQAASMTRCFKLETENYCLGLGFVDQLPTGADRHALMTEPSPRAAGDGETDIATGDLTPAAFVAQRAALPKSQRVTAELDEMQSAWDGRAKARELRELAEADSTSTTPTPIPAPSPTGTPTPVPTPTRTVPTIGTPTAVPSAPAAMPTSAYIMKGYQTSQEKGYWCGPATFQSIDWADDNQKDTQASWAKDLGATTSGTAISAMVQQTNLKTTWPKSAGKYIVQSVKTWNAQTFFTVHQKHLGVYKAPVIEHVQLLKRYFPYLAFNHSGHYQVGRGYNAANGTIAIFEVFNEHRFNSRGNVTDGPKNIPASALFNATLANSFQNIGL
jgi:hypothetical protein